ncbi:MAG TPA: MIP/aquaporin family protein [Ktedonobacterales bacterium]|nr:MIP/aquaporin family protein [Ktedonobacterales bacterium]
MKEPTLTQKLVAECIGTALLTLIGAGSVTATFVINNGGKSSPFTEADLGVISFAFGLIIVAMVYSIGKVSGCHINPAVTIALLVTGRTNVTTAASYIIAQFVGGLLGGLAIVLWFGTSVVTSGINGVTAYGASTSAWQAVVAEAIGTFILVFTIFGVAVDSRAPAGWAGLVIGLVVVAIIMTLGPVTNASLNPARSFGPVLVRTLFGGPSAWGQYWVYVVGPVLGAIAGGMTYDFVAAPKAAGK